MKNNNINKERGIINIVNITLQNTFQNLLVIYSLMYKKSFIYPKHTPSKANINSIKTHMYIFKI